MRIAIVGGLGVLGYATAQQLTNMGEKEVVCVDPNFFDIETNDTDEVYLEYRNTECTLMSISDADVVVLTHLLDVQEFFDSEIGQKYAERTLEVLSTIADNYKGRVLCVLDGNKAELDSYECFLDSIRLIGRQEWSFIDVGDIFGIGYRTRFDTVINDILLTMFIYEECHCEKWWETLKINGLHTTAKAIANWVTEKEEEYVDFVEHEKNIVHRAMLPALLMRLGGEKLESVGISFVGEPGGQRFIGTSRTNISAACIDELTRFIRELAVTLEKGIYEKEIFKPKYRNAELLRFISSSSGLVKSMYPFTCERLKKS